MNNQLLKTKYLEIDLNKRQYRRMHRIFLFFRVGIWKPLPKITSIAITKIKLIYRTSKAAESVGYIYPSITNRQRVYSIFLRSKIENIRIMDGEEDEIKRIAVLIGDYLEKPVINHLERKKVSS